MKNNNDRIICVSNAVPSKERIKRKNKYKEGHYNKVSVRGYHTFYYQPANSKDHYYLFSTKRYSSSIAAAFAERGVLLSDDQFTQTHSITIRELHRMKVHHNYALNKVFERIPVWVDDVIRYELTAPEAPFLVKSRERHFDTIHYQDDERTA